MYLVSGGAPGEQAQGDVLMNNQPIFGQRPFSYAPKVDKTPWYRCIGVDGIARAHYLWPNGSIRVQALGGLRLWNVTVEAGAELDSERNLNALIGAEYKQEVW